MSIFKDQNDFMVAAGQEGGQVALYAALIAEESAEFAEAFIFGVDVETIKEAVDVIVVAAGFLVTALGEEGAQKAWNAVYESNLAKTLGKKDIRADGKLLQNDLYKKVAKAKLMCELAKLR